MPPSTVGSEVTRAELVGRPSPLACLECRQKHLKCDAQAPRCSRCTLRGLNCSYTPSRRGCVGRSRKRRPSDARSPPPTTTTAMSGVYTPMDASTSTQVVLNPISSATTLCMTTFCDMSSAATLGANPTAQTEAHLLNLYSTHFHPTHPILLPRGHDGWLSYPSFLTNVVQWIGSQWAPCAATAPLQAIATRQIEAIVNPSPNAVQACLLFAIVLHARNEIRAASSALNKAVDFALRLQMYRADSPVLKHADPVVEESYRRTWWELWITDGYVAALNRQASWKCDSYHPTTPLPCDESAYAQGIIPLDAPSPQQFKERLFADDDLVYSSYCYRIEAMRIISRVLQVASSCDAHPDGVQAVDNAIAAWKHHLPKAGILDELGEVDQLMFQAHMFIHFASILLHFPRSELPLTLPSASEVACVKDISPVTPTSTQHAIKATAASKEMSNLAALPVPHYSPFFICGLVFGCMVQLSACYAHSGSCFEQHQDRVVLMTGVLKSMGRRWEIANCALTRLRPVANEIFYSAHGHSELGGSCAQSTSVRSTDDSGVDMSMHALPPDLNDLNWFDLFDGMQNQQFEENDLLDL